MESCMFFFVAVGPRQVMPAMQTTRTSFGQAVIVYE